MTIDTHMAFLAVSTLAAGYLMTVAGLRKNALEWRKRRRMCPSCGRELRTRVCTTCGGA
jgi:hypothetical protein